MALSIGSSNPNLHLQLARREKLNTEKSSANEQQNVQAGGDAQDVEDLSPAARLQRFAQSLDEMSAGAAQFRNRKAVEKKSEGGSESSFDRVLDEDVQPKVGKLLQALKGGDGAGIENLLRQAYALFPDESDLVLVLREMLRRRDLDETTRKRLKTLLSQAEKEADPKRLKAGINVALKARLLGKALQLSPALLRESYRGFLVDDNTESAVYQTWIATYGIAKRGIVVDFMEDALLADIDAADPSCSNLEFYVLQSRIGQIKRIRSSDILFVQGLLANAHIREVDEKEETWLLLLFGMIEQSDDLRGVLMQNVGDYFRFSARKVRARLLQILYWHCKKLPPEIFFSQEERDALLASFETLLGVAMHHEKIEMRQASE